MKKRKQKTGRGAQVELNFLESLAKRMPGDSDILKALGDLYTKAGRWKDGLQVDLELSRICAGEPLVWYNLACSYALLNQPDDAFASLSRAVELGYSDISWMGQDEDLSSIRADIRFVNLLKKMSRAL